MKELKTLSEREFQILRQNLEQATGLIFPDDPTRFGELKFHIYSGRQKNEFHFQVFWGPHNIFSQKHMKESSAGDLIGDLGKSLQKASAKITRAALQYCEDRLNDFLQIELQPVLMSNGLNALEIDIRVRQSKKTHHVGKNGGWPVWCLLMSWTDEFGEFQEFVHNIVFDEQERKFVIQPQVIVQKFIGYRNSLI